jgi:hypothetical protein
VLDRNWARPFPSLGQKNRCGLTYSNNSER